MIEPGCWKRVDGKEVYVDPEEKPFEYSYSVEFFDPNNYTNDIMPADRKMVQEFVQRLYNTCLGREAEPQGFNDWTEKLVSRQIDGATVGAGFVFSEEYMSKGTSNIEFLTMLYNVFMDREPEEAGIAYWRN